MNKELEMVRKLYDLSRGREWPVRPKQKIFSWKCPECNCTLKRESCKVPLFAEAGGDEFANRVIADHKALPGLYNITTDHFVCSCGYEYVGVKLDRVEM